MPHRSSRRSARSSRSRAEHRSRTIAFESLEPRLALTTFTVNSLTDGPVNLTDNVVTLRDAISAANNNVAVQPGGLPGESIFTDVIQFQAGLTGTITLTQGQLTLRRLVAINGPTSTSITISGNGTASRVFFVNDTSTTTFGGAVLRNLTIRGGITNQGGGGIFNNERLTIENVVVTANQSNEGGGIFNATGATLIANGSQIQGNQAGSFAPTPSGGGGGLFNAGTATFTNSSINNNSVQTGTGGAVINSGALTLLNTLINSNGATRSVGGISNSGVLKIANSTITNNVATASGGIDGIFGALFNQTAGTVTVQNSTISGNRATVAAGVYNQGTMTLENSTISGNIAARDFGGIANSGILTLRNSTIAANRANANNGSGIGAGLHNNNAFNVVMHNTIIADNLRGPIAGISIVDNFSGPAANTASSHNLIGPGETSGLPNGGEGGNQVGVVNTLLGPLASNGGPVQTHLLLAGSPGINAGGNAEIPVDTFDVDGDANTTEPLPFDERGSGFKRINGSSVDVGAVEVQSDPTADFDFDSDVDGADFLLWQRGLGVTGVAATRSNGNADNDNDVDGADLAVWKTQFASAAIAAVTAAGSPAPAATARSEALDAAMAFFTSYHSGTAADATMPREFRQLARRRWSH